MGDTYTARHAARVDFASILTSPKETSINSVE